MKYIDDLIESLQKLDEQDIEQVAEIIVSAKKVFVMGNGGSATTAQHFVQGLKWAGKEAYSLVDNIAIFSAIANDYDYASVFKRQLNGIIDKEDIVIGISASGNSENVIRAIEYVHKIGAITVGILGFDGGKLKNVVKKNILVKNNDYGQVEDIHLSICHIISYSVKEKITSGG